MYVNPFQSNLYYKPQEIVLGLINELFIISFLFLLKNERNMATEPKKLKLNKASDDEIVDGEIYKCCSRRLCLIVALYVIIIFSVFAILGFIISYSISNSNGEHVEAKTHSTRFRILIVLP